MQPRDRVEESEVTAEMTKKPLLDNTTLGYLSCPDRQHEQLGGQPDRARNSVLKAL